MREISDMACLVEPPSAEEGALRPLSFMAVDDLDCVVRLRVELPLRDDLRGLDSFRLEDVVFPDGASAAPDPSGP